MTEEEAKKELREKLALDLFIAFRCGGTNFNAQLFRLMSKADPVNLARLSVGFPTEVEVYAEWHNTPDERSFFRRHLLGKRLGGEREQAILDDMVGQPHRDDGGEGEGQGPDWSAGEAGWGSTSGDRNIR